MKHLVLIIVLSATLLAGLAFKSTVDVSIAKVERIQGLYVFTDSKPVTEYDYLGTVTIKGVGLKSPQYTVVRDALLKKLHEDYPQADGAIFYLVTGGIDKVDAIKFNN